MAPVKSSGLNRSPLLVIVYRRLNNHVAIVWGIILLAWGVTILATIARQDHWLHYDALNQQTPFLLKLILFLAAWQIMIAAMMLPSALPMVRLFVKVSSQQASRLTLLVFLAAYAAVWTGFALVTLAGDIALHQLWHHLLNPRVTSGLTLILAGGFQFSQLKQQCLKVCRHPFSFFTHHYQRGVEAAWKLGLRHGIYCLGCCWALMVVMVAVGIGHFIWMILLTGVMTLERTWKRGRELVPAVGIAFIAWGMLVLLNPRWLLNLLSHHAFVTMRLSS